MDHDAVHLAGVHVPQKSPEGRLFGTILGQIDILVGLGCIECVMELPEAQEPRKGLALPLHALDAGGLTPSPHIHRAADYVAPLRFSMSAQFVRRADGGPLLVTPHCMAWIERTTSLHKPHAATSAVGAKRSKPLDTRHRSHGHPNA
jgi:hypothetical protein